MIFLLTNQIQNFAWGSTDSMTSLFGIPNPLKKPQAEMWMGAHQNGCSLINKNEKLSDYIASSPELILGKKTCHEFGELPYLMKILAADQPLSVQVHPSKKAAEEGFRKENKAGIGITAFNRNYKDANHKPELVYALTPYLAMNAFRRQEEIARLFKMADIQVLREDIDALSSNPTQAQLKLFFGRVMSLAAEEKEQALAELLTDIESKGSSDEQAEQAFELVKKFSRLYPDDLGLFSPLLLNIVELQPGEAMFLYAQTPHAYIRGTGIEIMANSDNVLRAGLTPKYMDVPELLANTRFEPVDRKDLLMQPIEKDGRCIYPIPVDDFNFDVISADNAGNFITKSAEILLCIAGEVEIRAEDQIQRVKKGESVFIGADTRKYSVSGNGQFVRAYSE